MSMSQRLEGNPMTTPNECPTCGSTENLEVEDLYARLEAVTRERDEARALYQEAQHTIDKMDDAPYVDCICPGCPRKVPQAWASGMCEPCANEDCEHTDGAKATAQELREMADLNDKHAALIEEVIRQRDDLRAQLAASEAIRRNADEREAAQAKVIREMQAQLAAATQRAERLEADLAALRAAVAVTPEVVERLARVIFEADHIHSDGGHARWDRLADDYLALLRVDAWAVLNAIHGQVFAQRASEMEGGG